MNPVETIPLLIVVLLLVAAGGAEPDRMAINFDGDNEIDRIDDTLVVAGGTSTVSAESAVTGDIYVIGGTTRVNGGVDGDVTVLAGNLSIADTASLSGTVRTVSGETSIADGATVGEVAGFEPPATSGSPAQRVGTLLLQFVSLGVVGLWLVQRHPHLLANIGHAITHHPLVSGVTGSLAAVTLLVLFVYMAFTLLLIPVSVVGLIAELLIVLYGQIVFGYLIGRRLPFARTDFATVVGIGLFLLLVEALGAVPYLGGAVQLGLLAIGFGAVLNTYFGLRRFEPAEITGASG